MLRQETKADIAALKAELTKWMSGGGGAQAQQALSEGSIVHASMLVA